MMIKYPDSPVRARINAKRRCPRPEQHAAYDLPNQKFGDLMKAESLDPTDILWYTTCGLCAGLLEVLN